MDGITVKSNLGETIYHATDSITGLSCARSTPGHAVMRLKELIVDFYPNDKRIVTRRIIP